MSKIFECEELKHIAFENSSMRSKNDILSSINSKIHSLENGEGIDINHSAIYYQKYIELLKRFKASVEKLVLFNELEPWWSYDYVIEDTGITLHLSHADSVDFNEDETYSSLFIDTEFDLHKTKTQLLNVEQYANLYGVAQSTVRQWIRRGKLRSALKAGNEWRIPELAEVNGRGYSYGFYSWDDSLSGLAEEYKFINDYSSARISQDDENKNLFHIELSSRNPKKTPDMDIDMTTKEKEKFELVLISNPLVEAPSETNDTLVY